MLTCYTDIMLNALAYQLCWHNGHRSSTDYFMSLMLKLRYIQSGVLNVFKTQNKMKQRYNQAQAQYSMIRLQGKFYPSCNTLNASEMQLRGISREKKN